MILSREMIILHGMIAVELELLQKELEEQKRKKQSLMQLLLTGIVKVKA